MTTLSSIVELDDRVTPTLRSIVSWSEKADASLRTVDDSLRQVTNQSTMYAGQWRRNMESLKESTRAGALSVRTDLREIKASLSALTDRKHTVRVSADTTEASTRLRMLKVQLDGINSKSIAIRARSVGGGGSYSGFNSGGLASRSNLIGGSSGSSGGFRARGSFGPFSLSGSALSTAMLTLAPSLLSVAGGAIGVLTTDVAALGAAMTSTISIVGAMGAGVLAIGVPMAMAIKSTVSWKQKLDTATASLDKAKAGTKAYNTDLNNVDRIMREMPAAQSAILANYEALSTSWKKLVTDGPSGQRALGIINSALKEANGLLPFAATQMNRFTLVAAETFNRIQKDTPAFEHLLTKVFAPWPGYFGKMTMAAYNFGKGFAGILVGAKPFTDFMVNGISKIATRFDDWANSTQGQHTITKFFTDMIPVFRELVNLGEHIGSAIFKIAMDPQTQRGAIDFSKLLESFADNLPTWVGNMTTAASKLGPLVRNTFSFFKNLSNDLAPWVDTVVGGFDKATTAFNNASPATRHIAEALLLLAGVRGLPGIGTGIGLVETAIVGLVSGSGNKVKAMNDMTKALEGMTAAQAASTAVSDVPGGLGNLGFFGSRRARGAITKTVAGATPELEGALARDSMLTTGIGSPELLHRLASRSNAGAGMAEWMTPSIINGGVGFSNNAAVAPGQLGLDMSEWGEGAAGLTAVRGGRLRRGARALRGAAGGRLRSLGRRGLQGVGKVVHGAGGGRLGLTAAAEDGSIGLGATSLGVTGALSSVGEGVAGAAGAVAAAPVALVGAAAAAAAGSMWYAWKKNTDNVRGYVSKLWKQLTGEFGGVEKQFAKAFSKLGITSAGTVSAMKKTWTGLKDVFGGVGAILIHVLGGAVEMVAAIFQGLGTTISGVLDFVGDLIHGRWKDLWGDAVQIITGPFQTIAGIIGGAKDIVVNVIKDIAGLVGIHLNTSSSSTPASAAVTAPSTYGAPYKAGQGTNTGVMGGSNYSAPWSGAPTPTGTTGDAPVSKLAFGGGGPTGGPHIPGMGAVASAAKGTAHVAAKAGKGVAHAAEKAYHIPADVLHKIEGWTHKVTGALNPLKAMGPVGHLARQAVSSTFDKAKAALLKKAHMGDGKTKTGSASIDLDPYTGSTKGLGKIAGLNSKLIGVVAQLHKQFGVYVGEGLATGGHNPGSWHYTGDAADLWGTHAQLQAVWDDLKGNKSIGQLLFNGQQEYYGGAISNIPPGGAGSDPMHLGHVHVGVKGDAPTVANMTSSMKVRRRGSGNLSTGAGKVNIENVHINNGMDLKAFVKEVERHLNNLPMEDATGMTN